MRSKCSPESDRRRTWQGRYNTGIRLLTANMSVWHNDRGTVCHWRTATGGTGVSRHRQSKL